MVGMAWFLLGLWGLSLVLQVVVVSYLLGSRKWHVYRGLTAYLGINILQSCFLYGLYRSSGFNSINAKHAAWISQIPVLSMRAWALVDLCRLLLERYRGVWGLAWRILLFLAISLIALSVLTAGSTWENIVPHMNMGMEWITV